MEGHTAGSSLLQASLSLWQPHLQGGGDGESDSVRGEERRKIGRGGVMVRVIVTVMVIVREREVT
jgi:hypothetical protein